MFKFYEVGGCVRDEILGLQSKDIDYVAVPSDELLTSVYSASSMFNILSRFLKEEGFEIFLETPDCFTIRARFPQTHKYSGVADFVMARKEVGYIDGTRTPIIQPGTLYDDLARRDFTLNALAKDEDGKIIDYFDGLWALEAKMLITPLSPEETFLDDPLRMLRALRFSITKGFIISPIVWSAMFIPGLITKLEKVVSGERIREEVMKMMIFDTVKTMRLFAEIDKIEPRFTEVVFGKEMWLKPTFEKK